MAKIRLICVETDCGDAANVGGPIHVRHKTFDIECPPEVRAFLTNGGKYISTFISGAELIDEQETP